MSPETDILAAAKALADAYIARAAALRAANDRVNGCKECEEAAFCEPCHALMEDASKAYTGLKLAADAYRAATAVKP